MAKGVVDGLEDTVVAGPPVVTSVAPLHEQVIELLVLYRVQLTLYLVELGVECRFIAVVVLWLVVAV